jgi:Holliday junction resolvase
MDAFEAVVAAILQMQGYWTLTSVKVELTKEEKGAIGRPSSPRWELDIVAYRGKDNEVRVIECKSFLDSPGVDPGAFDGSRKKAEKQYKLFVEETLRKVVFARLKNQLVSGGFCAADPTIRLCLAAGKIRGAENWLEVHFKKKGWLLFGPDYIRQELKKLRESGYENSVAAVVTKLLMRDGKSARIKTGVDADV